MNSASVDLIYLDPPFNSDQNFAAPIGSEAAGAAFKDTWTLQDVDLAWHGEIAEREPAPYAIIDAAGLAHGNSMKAYLIMMSVRLLEMRRLLKSTGSIYLHCDPTASHYLKMTMDCVFGKDNFRNEIIWQRSTTRGGGRHRSKTLRSNSDTILSYARSDSHYITIPLVPNPNATYPHSDHRGRYRLMQCVANDALHGGNPKYTFHGYPSPPNGWLLSQDKMEALLADNRLHFTKSGRPYRKLYEHEYKGMKVGNIWTDIRIAPKQERTGYPTQKPLALLKRIIEMATSERDVVLDPFCGCATACVAAEELNRKWVGIDISSQAATLVRQRLKSELGLFYKGVHRTDIPQRTDLGDIPPYNADENKRTLYGKQEGRCYGCEELFPYRNMTVDHIVPQSKGGSDHLDNLQLLCSWCNSTKGAGTQEAFLARLRAQGVRT